MKKIIFLAMVFALLFAMTAFAGQSAIGNTYPTQISPTANTVLESGTGAIVAVWASADITTRVSDMYIVDASNTYTARTEATTLLKITMDAGDTGFQIIYKGTVYDGSTWSRAQWSGIPYENGVRVESDTTTGNAIIETQPE